VISSTCYGSPGCWQGERLPLGLTFPQPGHDIARMLPLSNAISVQNRRSAFPPTSLHCPEVIVDFSPSQSFIVSFCCRHDGNHLSAQGLPSHLGAMISRYPFSTLTPVTIYALWPLSELPAGQIIGVLWHSSRPQGKKILSSDPPAPPGNKRGGGMGPHYHPRKHITPR